MLKLKRNKKILFVFLMSEIFLGRNVVFAQAPSAQTQPTPVQKMAPQAVVQVAPHATEGASAEKNQILDKLMESLGMIKTVDQAIEYSGYYLKSVPKATNPAQQKKIADLYAAAQKEFDLRKEKTKMQTLAEIKDQYAKKFSIEELKYLLTLSQYEVFKKYNSFLDSESYAKATATPFTLTREAMLKLHEQVKSVDKTLKPKQ